MRVFTRVVETGSFSRASDQLGIPRSTASKLVSDLERHLGVELVERTTRKVRVTQEGRDYYVRAHRIVHEVDDADNALRDRPHSPKGPLRIEATSSFANLVLIPSLADFRARYPDIVLSVGISDRYVDLVAEGVDCAIRASNEETTPLVAHHLFSFENVTFASRSYLERRGIPETPDALADHDLIGYFSAATGKPMPLLFARDGRRREIERFALSTNETTGYVNMIKAGLGIGQNFREIIRPQLESGELVPILEEWTRPRMHYCIVYPPGRVVHARLRAFIDWAVARFAIGNSQPVWTVESFKDPYLRMDQANVMPGNVK
ncbi:LysR family transcriptional regulator [Novosphingobium profundi]|nr:LysR family transcriptional regulator [Novosphingobium profundi]